MTDKAPVLLYVDPAAAPGGDGSIERPFTTTQEAKDHVAALGTDATMYFGAGEYMSQWQLKPPS